MRPASDTRPAFTLLELAIVVVIVGVIAGIALSRSGSFVGSAGASAAAETTRRIQTRLDEHSAFEGAYPATILTAWFSGGDPVNPLLPDQSALVQYAPGGHDTEPVVKHAPTIATPAFWYNARSGSFRARVPAQESAAATLALYNKVNGTALTDLSQSRGVAAGEPVVADGGDALGPGPEGEAAVVEAGPN